MNSAAVVRPFPVPSVGFRFLNEVNDGGDYCTGSILGSTAGLFLLFCARLRLFSVFGLGSSTNVSTLLAFEHAN